VIAAAVRTLLDGKPVVLPFDTVYGLTADATNDDAVRALYQLKGRMPSQPTALVAASVDALRRFVPELRGTAEGIVRSLLPGPYTLILANPARRFPLLTGNNPDAIGVRVPDLPSPTREIVECVGAVVATSANHPGGRDPESFDEVPEDIRAGAGVAIDGGRVPGTPSTVVDLTGPATRILREGAVPGDEVLRRLGSAVRSS
jgi:L-threonylcarbamoyladenylate synthase